MGGLFLLEMGRIEKTFFIFKFFGFEPPPNQNKVKYYHNKCSGTKSVLIERTLILAKSRKTKKNRTKVCNLRKTKKR